MNITPSPDAIWSGQDASDRFTLFVDALRRFWWLLFGIVAVCVVGAVGLTYFLSSYWRVEITVMPVTSSNSVNIGSALSSGLAGLSGLGGLLGRPAGVQDEAVAILRSRELFDTYAKQKNLLPVLYADKWDAAAGHWDVPPAKAPTLRQAFNLFDRKIRDIDLDRRTGILTLSITWKDRQEAARWASDLITLTNSQLRQRALEESQRNMNYLSEQMAKAAKEGAQNTLTAALANSYDRELQNYMSAKGQQDFAFRTIDAPTIPDDRERVFPSRVLFAALGLLGGLFLGLLAVWFADRMSRNASALGQ